MKQVSIGDITIMLGVVPVARKRPIANIRGDDIACVSQAEVGCLLERTEASYEEHRGNSQYRQYS